MLGNFRAFLLLLSSSMIFGTHPASGSLVERDTTVTEMIIQPTITKTVESALPQSTSCTMSSPSSTNDLTSTVTVVSYVEPSSSSSVQPSTTPASYTVVTFVSTELLTPTSPSSSYPQSSSSSTSSSPAQLATDDAWGYGVYGPGPWPAILSIETSGIDYSTTMVWVSPSSSPTSSSSATSFTSTISSMPGRLFQTFGPPCPTPTEALIDPSITPLSLDLSFGISSNYFSRQVAGQNSSITCTNCHASGTLNFTDSGVTFNTSEAPASLETISQNGIMTLTLTEDFRTYIEINATVNNQACFELPLGEFPTFAFSIPEGTGVVGFAPIIHVESNLTAPLNLSTGFHLVVPSNSMIQLMLGQAEGSWVSGFNQTRMAAFPLTIYGSAEGSVNISFVPRIPIAWQFFEGAVEVQLGVAMNLPTLQLTIAKQNSSDPGCLLDSNNQTTVYSTNLTFGVEFEAFGSVDLSNALPQPESGVVATLEDTVGGGMTTWDASMVMFSSTRALANHCVPTPTANTTSIASTSMSATATTASSSAGSISGISTTSTPSATPTPLGEVVNLSRPGSEGSLITNGCGLGLVVLAMWFIMVM